ncbi:MAG: hypothetical protein ACKVRO_08660 [Micropepsaceae bacterium]
MLLRDTNTSDFRVPLGPRRPIAADDANAKADRQARSALRRRDERDTRLASAHERARARTQLLKMFAQDGQKSVGLVARADEALKAYRASPDALTGDDFDALSRDVRGQAMRLEAPARARERVVQLGKTLDTLIEATRAAPQNFAAHADAAREAIEQLKLPAKAAAAMRARVTDIPEAALAALIERDPQHAADLIKTHEGPADAAHGLDRATLRVLGKQAATAMEEAGAERANSANIAAMRAHADAANAIEAAARGEGDEAGLTAWLAQAETIEAAATRTLRRQSKAAAKTVADRKTAAAAIREKLARGQDIGDANDEAVDHAYAGHGAADKGGGRAFAQAAGRMPAPLVRSIAADLKSGDPTRAQRAAELVVELEQKDEKLVTRLPPALCAEAHNLATAAKAGFNATDAALHLRDAPDLNPTDRNRRTASFDRTIDGAALARAVEQTFAVRVAGIADD